MENRILPADLGIGLTIVLILLNKL